MDLPQYRNIFGPPRTGWHSYRLFDLAIVDVIGTILVAIIISALTDVSLAYAMIALFTTGIIAHRVFHVNTTVGTLIFGKLP
jgi:hypothetical protein